MSVQHTPGGSGDKTFYSRQSVALVLKRYLQQSRTTTQKHKNLILNKQKDNKVKLKRKRTVRSTHKHVPITMDCEY